MPESKTDLKGIPKCPNCGSYSTYYRETYDNFRCRICGETFNAKAKKEKKEKKEAKKTGKPKGSEKEESFMEMLEDVD